MPPMKAVGTALRICSTIRTDECNIKSTTNIPPSDTAASAAIQSVADRWLSNCPPYSIV